MTDLYAFRFSLGCIKIFPRLCSSAVKESVMSFHLATGVNILARNHKLFPYDIYRKHKLFPR